jgi:uncharacterized DUF497 family protein
MTNRIAYVKRPTVKGDWTLIDVEGLVFDDENEAKFASHGVNLTEVQEVFGKWPRYYVNRSERRASHVMVGPTRTGRLLVVPIEEWGGAGLWRPVTAFEATPGQAARYRSKS